MMASIAANGARGIVGSCEGYERLPTATNDEDDNTQLEIDEHLRRRQQLQVNGSNSVNSTATITPKQSSESAHAWQYSRSNPQRSTFMMLSIVVAVCVAALFASIIWIVWPQIMHNGGHSPIKSPKYSYPPPVDTIAPPARHPDLIEPTLLIELDFPPIHTQNTVTSPFSSKTATVTLKGDAHQPATLATATAATTTTVGTVGTVKAIDNKNNKDNGKDSVSPIATEQEHQSSPRVIVIGDVHGSLDALQRLINQTSVRLPLKAGEHHDLVILSGDLTTKGPDSTGVLDYAASIGAKCVRGNHDEQVIQWYEHLYPLRSLVRSSESPASPASSSSSLHSEEEFEELVKASLASVNPINNNHSSNNGGDDNNNNNDDVDNDDEKYGKGSELVFGSEHYDIALRMTHSQYTYLAQCPYILAVPALDVVVAHAGLLPNKKMNDQDPEVALNIRNIDPDSLEWFDHKRSGVAWFEVWNRHQVIKDRKRKEDKKQAKITQTAPASNPEIMAVPQQWIGEFGKNDDESQELPANYDSLPKEIKKQIKKQLKKLKRLKKLRKKKQKQKLGGKHTTTPEDIVHFGGIKAESLNLLNQLHELHVLPSQSPRLHSHSTLGNLIGIDDSRPLKCVYGHTAGRGLQIHPYSFGLDTGCVYGRELTALVIPQYYVTSVQCEAPSQF